MAIMLLTTDKLLKNQRPVVYYGGLIGAGLLAWQITEWLDRRYRLSRPDLFGAEYMMGFDNGDFEMWHWADVPEDIIKQGKNAIAEYIWMEGELCDGEEWDGMEEDLEDSGDDWQPLLDTLQKV